MIGVAVVVPRCHVLIEDFFEVTRGWSSFLQSLIIFIPTTDLTQGYLSCYGGYQKGDFFQIYKLRKYPWITSTLCNEPRSTSSTMLTDDRQ